MMLKSLISNPLLRSSLSTPQNQTLLAQSVLKSQAALAPFSLYMTQMRGFTGKTESGFKFKTPKMRLKHVTRVFPPPGLDLRIPMGLTHETFLRQIGGDCEEVADKFENIDEVFKLDSVSRIYEAILLHCPINLD